MAIKVALVEDDPAFVEHIEQMITQNPNVTWTKAFTSAEAFLEEFRQGFRPDVVLMDFELRMSGGTLSGVECIWEIKQKYPKADIQFIMYTAYQTSKAIFGALKAGAVGYVTKADGPERLIKAIQMAELGGSYMSASVARFVMEYFNQHEKQKSDILTEHSLTDGERDVLDLLVEGYSYKEVASKLNLPLNTVQSRITNIYKKLGVHSKAEAILAIKGRIMP